MSGSGRVSDGICTSLTKCQDVGANACSRMNRLVCRLAEGDYANSAGRIKARSSGTVELIRGLTG